MNNLQTKHKHYNLNKTLYGALTRWGYTTEAHYC